MNDWLSAKLLTSFIFLAALFFPCAEYINAQQKNLPPPENSNKSVKTQSEDISITANVTAKELKFDVVPNPSVEFPGTFERENVWEADRQNLPKPVEPGVTYRNIGIKLRISSRFADIDRIVAEALGEIPVSNDPPPDSPQTQNSGNKLPTNAGTQKTQLLNNRNKKP